MKNFCDSCKVSTENDRSHCPLCGKCVNEENLDKPRKFNKFPDYQWNQNRKEKIALYLLIFLTIGVLSYGIIEFFATKKLFLSWYFLVGAVYSYFVWVLPPVKKWGFSTSSILQIIFTCGLVVFIELYSNTFGWGVAYVIPMFILAASIGIYIVMLARGYYARSTLYPSLVCAILASALFGLNFTVLKNLVPFWPALCAFATSVVLLVTLIVFKRRKIMKGLKKDFNF